MSIGSLRVPAPRRGWRVALAHRASSALLPEERFDVLMTTPSRARGSLAGWMATLGLLAAAYTALTLTAPPARTDVFGGTVAAAAGAGGLAVYVLLRASRLPTARGITLAFASIAIAAGGVVLGTRPPGGAVDGLRLSRESWLLLLAGLVLPGLAIRRLVGELRARVAHLARLSRTDPLTGVANRLAWDEELPREASRAQRDRLATCIALIDVDRLGAFNDLRGHAEGDLLLRRVASSWHACVRGGDLVARLDGGRFGVLLRRCPIDQAVIIMERLRVCMPDAQTASVGVASWEGREGVAAALLRAENALVAAKRRGRDRICVAPAAGTAQDSAFDNWVPVVRQVLAERSVVSVYQPIVDLGSGAVCAYEALARPDAKVVDISVERMFSTAQQMGLARELDWLCRRAALSDTSWLPRGTLLFVNCNIGLLTDPVHRVDQMLLVMAAAGLNPADLVLEITERELAGDLGRLRVVVDAYRREGFRFAVDDVGEGHSTLEVLATVRPEFVKIARSLVIEVGNVGARAAIRAVVAFARESGALVIAEGIEQRQTAADMRNLGVDMAQGYLFGRPGPPVRAAA
ncbi:MAG TPA: bifunctional diguanylate cyclase/phosphodiesterase [Candidatus Dormibacteraeota bacterium]|nr:bifunctional diguanylate cyclase/phosphodiesterase [Candidatus Dormibacteraeota bacterium]